MWLLVIFIISLILTPALFQAPKNEGWWIAALLCGGTGVVLFLRASEIAAGVFMLEAPWHYAVGSIPFIALGIQMARYMISGQKEAPPDVNDPDIIAYLEEKKRRERQEPRS